MVWRSVGSLFGSHGLVGQLKFVMRRIHRLDICFFFAARATFYLRLAFAHEVAATRRNSAALTVFSAPVSGAFHSSAVFWEDWVSCSALELRTAGPDVKTTVAAHTSLRLVARELSLASASCLEPGSWLPLWKSVLFATSFGRAALSSQCLGGVIFCVCCSHTFAQPVSVREVVGARPCVWCWQRELS